MATNVCTEIFIYNNISPDLSAYLRSPSFALRLLQCMLWCLIQQLFRMHGSNFMTYIFIYCLIVHNFDLKVYRICIFLIDPPHNKNNNMHRRKQRRRSADQNLCFRYTDSTHNPKFPASSLLSRLYRPVCVRPGWKPKLLVFPCVGLLIIFNKFLCNNFVHFIIFFSTSILS